MSSVIIPSQKILRNENPIIISVLGVLDAGSGFAALPKDVKSVIIEANVL